MKKGNDFLMKKKENFGFEIKFKNHSEDDDDLENLNKMLNEDNEMAEDSNESDGQDKNVRELNGKVIVEENEENDEEDDEDKKGGSEIISNVIIDPTTQNKTKKTNKRDTAISLNTEFIGFNKQEGSATLSELQNIHIAEESSRDSEIPWLKEKTKRSHGILKLHYEILDFYEFVKPTQKEDETRTKSYHLIKNVLKEHFPEIKIKLFGSFPTKLHLPGSDIDLVVLSDNYSQYDQLKLLKRIHRKLVQNDIVEYIQLIEARVPIIRATIKGTKVNVDISANRKNGYQAKKTIKSILQSFPFMRPLIYVLKYYLKQRGLNEVYTGGLSSFLLFNLLLAYVQHLVRTDTLNDLNLGNLLCGFFQFYSSEFNYEDVGISLRYGGFFFKKNERGWLICLKKG